MQIDINVIIADLKEGKSKTSQESLDKLNALLEARYEAGEKDYSIATIGKVSKESGGIGTVSIRNKTGEHFRRLIDAWATKASTTMKKPPVAHSRLNYTPKDEELLQRLDDPALRAIFGQIIAQKKRLEAENRILKNQAEVIVDMRPNKQPVQTNAVEVMPSIRGLLLESELNALKDAIDEGSLARKGLTKTPAGAIKDADGQTLFKVGFANAIQKILE